ncbi:hypothetical protein F4804DRAFT_18763 [Jackrogersella minutella]|nr:hypothetical protein F4804DRAFT_18763 [Jackrogersella minutella]
MTSAESLVYYPAYCFHLSPTINKWCPLRAIDIHGLESRPGFEGDNVFFSLNHPIRWVRILGVVVAIDELYGRRVYTVDDSTGRCIECSVDIPKPKDTHRQNGVGCETTAAVPAPAPDPNTGLDVGMVVEVKGSTKLFRDQKQIKVQKLQRIRSTTQEVQFWDKIRDFRKDVLSRPWVLERKEVRRCKKQHMADVDAEETKAKQKRKKLRENGYILDRGVRSKEPKPKSEEASQPTKQKSLAETGVRDSYTAGQYDALGL